MKILFVPNLIVSSLSDKDRANILEATGPGSRLVEVKDSAAQRRELPDTDIIFGRVHADNFHLAKQIVYYHSIGAGVDNILTTELVNHAVPLASEKGDVGIHLAEHAFALLLSLTRGLHTAIRTPDYELREPIRVHQRELFDTTMGIVGFGGTGRAVAKRAVGFGMRVLGVDIEDVAPEPGVEAIWPADRLPDLLRASDVVVICLPLTKATHHLFTRERFAQMQRHAIIINVTRGEIIRGEDVLAALEEGLIWGAGLDVTDPEPLPKDHPLWRHPRAIVTPHTAGGSPRRAGRVIATFCENLRRRRDGRPLLAPSTSKRATSLRYPRTHQSPRAGWHRGCPLRGGRRGPFASARSLQGCDSRRVGWRSRLRRRLPRRQDPPSLALRVFVKAEASSPFACR